MDIQTRKFPLIAAAVGCILLVLLSGNLFISGWNWGILDFVLAGVLLSATGLAIGFALRKLADPAHRTIVIITIVAALLLIWAELAVDAVSQFIRFLLV